MEYVNIIIQILLPVLATLITSVFTYVGIRVKNIYQERVQSDMNKQIVNDVVKFVEQVYTDIHGTEKLQKAVERASSLLEEKGVYLTDTEINTLIESAVYGLNHGLMINEEVITD